jgi:hypothetical protein
LCYTIVLVEIEMIQISGLTARQQELLDVMWTIPSFLDLELWISSLDYDDARDAQSLSTLLIYEHCDQILEQSQDYTQAKEILSRF